MPKTLSQKIIEAHLLSGEPRLGQEIAIRVDQTLTQDSLGAVSYLQFEALERQRVSTELSLSYCDHLLIQLGNANADVHAYLASVASKYGIVFSKPGNGICHQVHLERFSRPGKTLIGGDSHTVTCGAMAMLAIGAGGLDVVAAMGGNPFNFIYPRQVQVWLKGQLQPWCSAKDIALELLRQITTQGNQNTILEYAGPGLQGLSVPERATIANMGAESGVTASLFPADQATRDYLRRQGREEDYQNLSADPDAAYDACVQIDLDALQPLVAMPHSPDRVRSVAELSGLPVQQVLIGSCTNSSFQDLQKVALILDGHKIPAGVELAITPGSRQVLHLLAANGALASMVAAGARITESCCGFCVGQGLAPQTAGVSVRTNNRNYQGRSGTKDALVYLVSPETAAATALNGVLTDPRTLPMACPSVALPERFVTDDSMFIFPDYAGEIFRSPIIGEPPANQTPPQTLQAQVAIRVGDMINTDDIIPGGPAMDYRANIAKSCEFIFRGLDEQLPARCKKIRAEDLFAVIVAGESYGQGSSREHAAMCPMVMGVKMVLAKSFERIHESNLVNFGILPVSFADPADYQRLDPLDSLLVKDYHKAILSSRFMVYNESKQLSFAVNNHLSERQRQIILAGGLLNSIKGDPKAR